MLQSLSSLSLSAILLVIPVGYVKLRQNEIHPGGIFVFDVIGLRILVWPAQVPE